MPSKAFVKQGGVWEPVRPLSVRVGGVWEEVEVGSVKVAGVWETCYLKADPVEHVYDMTWHACYNDTSLYTGSQRDRLGYNGYASSTSRKETTIYGFDYAQIQADLAVRPTISSITVEIECRWSYSGSGKNVTFGEHNYGGSAPSTITIPGVDQTEFFTRGQRRTITLPTSFAEHLRDGTAKGLALPYTNTSQPWGYMAATYTTTVLTSSPSDAQTKLASPGEMPRLRITSDY